MNSRKQTAKTGLLLLGITVITLSASCDLVSVADTFTRDNALDPGADNYQGYTTVDSFDQLAFLSPSSGASSSFFPGLMLTELVGAGSYQFQLASSSAALDLSPALDASGAENFLDPVTIVPSTAGTWYLRARVRNSEGLWSGWVPSDSGLSLEIEQPFSAQEETTADTSPEISWEAVNGVSEYEYLWSAVSAADLENQSALQTDETSFTISSLQSLGTTIFWKVRGIDAEGRSTVWSPVQQLLVDWDIPDWNLSPSDGTSLGTASVTLSWADIGGAVAYEFRIDTVEANLPVASVVTVETSQFEYTGEADQFYYWQVRAKNGNGAFSSWSSPAMFSIHQRSVVAEMFTGSWPEEVYWEILDADGTILLQGGPYSEENTSQPAQSVSLPSGVYTLRGEDSYGDGWNGGALDIRIDGSIVVDDFAVTGSSDSIDFTVP